MSVLLYLKLFRLDVGIIAFVSYLLGVRLVTSVNIPDCLIAMAVALVSTNFIYSFNAWADWRIDAINKPERPIPTGLIAPEAAFKYSMVLLCVSVLYPFFIANSGLTLFLFLLLPVLGLVYSTRPFLPKRYAIPSVLITSTGLVIPIQLGYFRHASDYSPTPFFLVLFVYCVSVVILKDIEDVRGDVRFGMENLFHRYGRRLLVISLAGLGADLLLLALLPFRYDLKLFMVAMILSAAFVIVFLRNDLRRIYPAVIRVVIVEGILLFVFLWAIGP